MSASRITGGLNKPTAEQTDTRAGHRPQSEPNSQDRRTASKRRIANGIRCFRTYHNDVDMPAMLGDLGYAIGASHADTERALQQFLDELIEDHKQAVAGDMSPQGSFRCAILADDR